MTARSTGAGYERRAKDFLLAVGFRIHQARPSLFWKNGRPISFSYDLHKVFDMNGLHHTLPDTHVQVTSHENRAKRQRKVEAAVGDLAGNGHHRFEVWSFGKQERLGHHLHIERLRPGGWSFVGNYTYKGVPIGETDNTYTAFTSPSSPTLPT